MHKLRFLVIAVGLIVASLNIWSMSMIESESDNAIVLKKSNPIQLGLEWTMKEFWIDDITNVDIVYGIKPYLKPDPEMDRWRGQTDGNLIRYMEF